MLLLEENGGWCWNQDERAIVNNGILLFGTVADSNGIDGAYLDGNIEVTAYDLKSKIHRCITILHQHLEADDHNVPALQKLDDGRTWMWAAIT